MNTQEQINPWAPGSWNLTQQGEVIKADKLNNTNNAERLAREAGTTVGALSPAQQEETAKQQAARAALLPRVSGGTW
jgi:hypothetical protein